MAQVALQVGAAGSVNSENDVRITSGLDPQAVAATLTTEPKSVDMQGYDALSVVLQAGVCTDGEYTITLTDSADDTTFAAVAGLDAAFTVITSAVDEFIEIRRVREFDSAGAALVLRRFVKMLVTESSAGTTGVIMSISFILGNKRSSIGDNVT